MHLIILGLFTIGILGLTIQHGRSTKNVPYALIVGALFGFLPLLGLIGAFGLMHRAHHASDYKGDKGNRSDGSQTNLNDFGRLAEQEAPENYSSEFVKYTEEYIAELKSAETERDNRLN